MKWLFVTLLGLNLIVFGGMIASKIYIKEQDETAKSNQPQTIIINPSTQQGQITATVAKASDVTVAASGVATSTQPKVVVVKPNKELPKEKHKDKEGKITITGGDAGGNVVRNEPTGEPRVRYKECSAKVNMPEDDYHRIKGLLNKYPHAASRQVTENHGEGGGQTSSRMNVLFMSVSDQDASAIQAVVGRYGQLSRTPCNK